MATSAAPRTWWDWNGRTRESQYTVGIEEEAMLLDPEDWMLAHHSDRVLEALPPEVVEHATDETHRSALELATGVHDDVRSAMAEMESLRRGLDGAVRSLGMRVASAGTHPSAVWQDTVVSKGKRYAFVYGSMRELARREPTFALHVHVGIRSPNDAIRLVNRIRAHLPLLLALSVNSPYWQGRDTGLASARTPLFQAFPRVGIPRRFRDYADYVDTVDLLMRCESMPDPTFLWWDARPQPRFGTVEVRIMDAQTRLPETAALAALVQCIARLEVERGYVSARSLEVPEALDENRFLAARDGMSAELIDVELERRVPAREVALRLVEACTPHARALGCEAELDRVATMAERTGADRQLDVGRGAGKLGGLVSALADAYV
ncbi:MAG: glutamate---cysteine ligase / carboxylate-amine ligase [Thermoleophilaceae bacterium]|jgi:carboxylate-amine ligase|nr:glutamate---cysteine ligase / carboxylate-amine ligase [Thermoleophilaceae bacterium]